MILHETKSPVCTGLPYDWVCHVGKNRRTCQSTLLSSRSNPEIHSSIGKENVLFVV